MFKLDIFGLTANKIGTGEYHNVFTSPEYLAWVEAGNVPEPADVPNPKIAIQAQIDTLEAQQLLPRITREFMLSAAETQAKAAGVDPMTNVGYAKLKEFDTQIAGLRAQI
jgi:hypothetical protein